MILKFIWRDLDSGVEKEVYRIDYGMGNEKVLNGESPFSISPDDKYLFYWSGWALDIEDSTTIVSDSNYSICGYDRDYSWKNDTTIVYPSCNGTISEYNIVTTEITEIGKDAVGTRGSNFES